LLLAGEACASPVYHIEQLENPGGTYARAISDRGSITGGLGNSAYLVTKKGDLRELAGGLTEGEAVNDHDQVAVSMLDENLRCGLWDTSTAVNIDLGTLGGQECNVGGLNNAGHVVGSSKLANGRVHAFFSDGTSMVDLGTLGGNESSAAGINDQGQIAGTSRLPDNSTHAFIEQDGVMTDIGGLGGDYTTAQAINAQGHIVGVSVRNPNVMRRHAHSYLWDGHKAHDLGTLGGNDSVPYAVNKFDEVVGESRIAGGGNTILHAYLYTDGAMYDLQTLLDSSGSRWSVLTVAWGINDKGDIVGLGSMKNGQQVAFVARRVSK
jgi:probable HAF family extracellular repeat protein